MIRITNQDIETKRQQVRWAYEEGKLYDDFEFYESMFDQLHYLTIKYMAQKYCDEHGLPQDTKTPYC